MKFHDSFAARARQSKASLRRTGAPAQSLRLLCGLLLCCCAVTALAQQTEKSDTLKIDTTLVSVPLIVSDPQGRYVAGLQASDFTLYENRGKQQIDFFGAVEEP